MFQPNRFEFAEGEQLKEWERHLREDVGLQGIATENLVAITRTITYTSGGHRGDIDIDAE
jgi:hypothetical protein